MEKEIKHSKEYLKAQHKADHKVQEKLDKQNEKKSFESMCKVLDSLIKDKQYKSYKYLLETRIQLARYRRDKLKDTVKTTDEYLRLALILDTEISVLQEILEIPDKFALRLQELKNEELTKRGG